MALPSGYSQLRYIQSSGTQYIDSGFKPNNNTRVVMDVQAVGTSGTYFAFGARESNASKSFCFFHYEGWSADYQSNTQRKTVAGINYTDRMQIDFDKTTCTVNGKSVSFTAATFQCPVTMHLFAVNTNGTISGMIAAKLFACKIYDNGTLVRDFVPAMDSSGAVGLYDLVNNTFYANAGTGSFTAGPLVTGPVDGVGVCIINAASFAINAGKCILNGAVKEITEGMTLTAGTAKKIALKSGIDVAALAISYTGAYTDQLDVVMSGKTYRLLTLTGSGTLTVPEEVTADVWMCNGGNGGNGGGGGYVRPGHGGGGGYVFQETRIINGSVKCIIGAGGSGAVGEFANQTYGGAGGSTSLETVKPKVQSNGENGASGGGGVLKSSIAAGKGDGVTTMPFGETATGDSWRKYHSAGGGGGGYNNASGEEESIGGNGGSNGANGKVSTQDVSVNGGYGGEYGGGRGGSGASGNGKDATWYGSGGGGGGAGYTTRGSARYGNGGAGYQGVIYVRIPYEQ